MRLKQYTGIMACILIIHFFVEGAAFGKCPYKEYKITGVVQEEKSGQAIAGAKLHFFFDDMQRTLTYGYETRYPDFFKTDDRGAFSAAVYFDSYSGWLVTDRCNKKPADLTVIIIVDGYPARRMEFDLKKLLSADGAIKLPPISLSKPIEK